MREKAASTPSAVKREAGAAGPKAIVLPRPRTSGGTSVLAALAARSTEREIGPDPLPLKTLSTILWAAFGVNRARGPFGAGGRTAASASNSREIGLYAALADGIYLYEAIPHRLTPAAPGDLRELAIGRGQRGTAAGKAPLNIIYVADIERYETAGFQEPGLKDPEVQTSYFNVAVGLIAGNVYLAATALGLAAWFHNCDKAALEKALKLRPSQRVLYGQTVGYPAKRR